MKMKERATYDRAAVGARLVKRRKLLGYSRSYIAQQVGIVEKYYADIERGTCGMSVETMMALADFYRLSLDEFIYGEQETETEADELDLRASMGGLSQQEKQCCVELVNLFVRGIKQSP